MVRKLAPAGGEDQSVSQSPPADAPGLAGCRKSSGRCGTCNGYIPLGAIVNRPEFCRSANRVSLKAPVKFCAAPEPWKYGTATTGFCVPTSLITTEPSCADRTRKIPDKIANSTAAKDFLFIALIRTRI